MIAAASIYECTSVDPSRSSPLSILRSRILADDRPLSSIRFLSALHGTHDESQPGVPATFQVIFLVRHFSFLFLTGP
jgi:hypothetical protein